MLRKILTISGRPGLFRLLSQGKNMLIVEDIATAKRIPVHSRDRVSSLGDISMYTVDGDKPLAEVLEGVKTVHGGKPVDMAAIEADLRSAMAAVLPDYDTERVRVSDIKKLFQWYNTLVANGVTDFVEAEAAEPEAKAAEPAEKAEAAKPVAKK